MNTPDKIGKNIRSPWGLVLMLIGGACGGSAADYKTGYANDAGSASENSNPSGPKSGGTSGAGAPASTNPGMPAPSVPGGQPPQSGAGGSSASGAGGRSGTGGSQATSADAGAVFRADASASARDAAPLSGADAGVGGPALPPPCSVALSWISPNREPFGLLPGTRVRVRAVAAGPMAPAMPNWGWTVTHASGATIPTTKVAGAPDEMETVLTLPGGYIIRAAATPTCFTPDTSNASTQVASERQSIVWIRVIPPAGVAAPVLEDRTQISAGQSSVRELQLQQGRTVSIDPIDAGLNKTGIRSFVRINSDQSTVSFEGHTATAAFKAILNPALLYNLLVLPDEATPAVDSVAPMFFLNRSPAEIESLSLVLDQGILLSGYVGVGAMGETPLPGARVLLRAGALTSTVGRTDVAGRYRLRVRAGNFQLLVVPPAGQGLADAALRAGEIYPVAEGSKPVLDFRYPSPDPVDLNLSFVDPAGGAVYTPVRVRIEAQDIPQAGSFREGGNRSTAVGSFRQEKTSSGGTVSFTLLPKGKYTISAVPVNDMATLGLLSATVDLSFAPRTNARELKLPARTKLSGTLMPAAEAEGRMLLAIDLDANLSDRTISSAVGSGGKYELLVDPARRYRLVLEPSADRTKPRAFLGTELSGTTDRTLSALRVPTGLLLSGKVQGAGAVRSPLAGALLQIFCTGRPPECIDPDSPASMANPPLPLAETATDGSGQYRLYLPDPATTNL